MLQDNIWMSLKDPVLNSQTAFVLGIILAMSKKYRPVRAKVQTELRG